MMLVLMNALKITFILRIQPLYAQIVIKLAKLAPMLWKLTAKRVSSPDISSKISVL